MSCGFVSQLDVMWTQFIDELKQNFQNVEKHVFLSFTEQPLVGSNTIILFLESYRNLLHHVTANPLVGKDNVIITGQSGIGKSTLAILLMRQLIFDGKPFCISINGPTLYCWNRVQEAYTTLISDNCSEFHDTNYTWIIDNSEHGPFTVARCKRILIASAKEKYELYAKNCRPRFVYLPLPSADEIHAIASMNGLTRPEVSRRLSIAGRITRFILDPCFLNVEKNIKAQIKKCSFEASIERTMYVSIGAHHHSSCIFHSDANDNFEETNLFLGSPFIVKLYMDEWSRRDSSQFHQYIANRDALSEEPIMYGKAFERYCHSQLKKGGTFRCKLLHSMNLVPAIHEREFKKRIKERRVQYIDTCAENIMFIGEAYNEPMYGNFGAMDSLVLFPDMPDKTVVAELYRVTFDLDQGCNGAALDALLRYLKDFTNTKTFFVKLYFVVPETRFDNFGMQPYASPFASISCMEQYVLGVPTDKPLVGFMSGWWF